MGTWSFRRSVLGLLVALLCSPAPAAVFDLDFEQDPEGLGVEFFGTSEWRDADGFDNTGYLSITDALNQQRGAIVFPDLENGEVLRAFSIEADLRVGGGTASPADGFSFNFARPDDPVLDDGEDWAASPTNELNLPEEGTTTGLAIGFDEWFSGGSDVIGMSLRLDNTLLNQRAFPVQNGEVGDTDSLQTGPSGVFEDELQDLMGWAHLTAQLCANNLTVTYKGVEVFNETVEYAPSTGQLVFGGRTGDSNAYHHIDNIVVRTGDDVGAGCNVTPPTYVAGQGTIGSRSYEGASSNEVFGPVQAGVPGWSVRMVDTDIALDTHTLAEDILLEEEGVTASYRVVNMASGGAFPNDDAYPDGTTGTALETFALQAVADVVIPAGTWTIAFGSDDGGQLTIPGIEFSDVLNSPDSFESDEIRFEIGRGHEWTVGTFELTEPLATGILSSMHENTGGDSYEIALIEGNVLENASPDTGWELLTDGTFGWEVTHTGTPLLSADLSAAVSAELPMEFDVDGDTDMADQLVLENPDPAVYSTLLDVTGVTFQINGTGSFTDGDAFSIVVADQIIGTPAMITSVDPSHMWTFNASTGQIIFGTGGGLAGDFNMNGMLDAGDIDDLTGQVAGGTNPSAYDLNADSLVNTADMNMWIESLFNSWIGDANLDGEFNSGDLVAVLASGTYEQDVDAVWTTGDFTGDGRSNSGDLVAALSGGGYEAGPKAAVAAAVPEPSSLVLALLSVLGLVGVARRQHG